VELPEWEVLDSATMKINAEDAYRIAEKAGGNAFDHCRIRAINSLDDEYSGWYIYYRRNGSRSFDIVVNDRSGDYEIISE
jgi:hypothetical protein